MVHALTRGLLLLIAGAGLAQASAEESSESPPTDGVAGECARALGGGMGFIPTTLSWELIGNGPLVVTGSPILAMSCHGKGKTRPTVGMMTAPFQRHYYRDAGRGSLLLVPHVGVERGTGRWRYGAHAVIMPRLVGGGLSVTHRFTGDGWLQRSGDGSAKGVTLRVDILDGDAVSYNVALLYTFGVTKL